MSWLSTFLTSPGAGGLGAFGAAAIAAGAAVRISHHRQQEARVELANKARESALERWWTRYEWLSANTELPLLARIEILGNLR